MKTYKRNQQLLNIPISLAIGLLTALMITGLGAIFSSSMIHNGSLDESTYGTVTFIIWLLASFAGSFVSGLIHKEKSWIVSLLSVAAYLFLMLSVSIVFFEGNLQKIGQGILAITIGYTPTLLLNSMKSRKQNVKVRYRRS